MNILKIKIQGQNAKWENPCDVVSGSQKYIYLKPTFDKIWEGLSIKFLFSDRNGNEVWNVLEDVDTPEGVQSLVRVPADIIVPPYFNVGVMGYGTDNQFIPTAGLRIEVIDNGYDAYSKINGVSDEDKERLGEIVLREYKAVMDGYESEMIQFRNVMAVYAEAEAKRITEEEVRIQNEKARATQEAAREGSEENRTANEGDRMYAELIRAENEENRRQEEAERVLEENMRQDAETIRAANEAARVRAENERTISESGRDNAEDIRSSAELNRVTAENEREDSETLRRNAEDLRSVAESERISAEKSRISNENERALAEISRSEAFGVLRGRLETSVLETEDTNVRANEALDKANVAVQDCEDAKKMAENAGVEAKNIAETAGAEAKNISENAGAEAKAIAESAGAEAKAIAEDAGEEAKTIAERAGAEAKVIAENAGAEARTAAANANNAAQSVVNIKGSFSNALKGSAFGQSVNLTDVSPVEHTMDVRVKSKNIARNIVFRNGKPNQIVFTANFNIEKGKRYIISFDTLNTGNRVHVSISLSYRIPIEGQIVTKECNGNRQTFIFEAKDDFLLSGVGIIQAHASNEVDITEDELYNIMIEEGEVATEYTPYLTAATVKMYGKNLFDPKEAVNRTTHGITSAVQEDGGITFSGVATATYRYFTPNSFKNQILLSPGTYTLSGHDRLVIQVRYLDGTSENLKGTFTLKKYGFLKDALLNGLTVGDEYNMTIYPSLVVGSVAEYESYKEPTTYNVNADGTVEGVTSVYLITTLMADSGAVVDVTYNRDINKAYLELEQKLKDIETKLTNAIISTGGNV